MRKTINFFFTFLCVNIFLILPTTVLVFDIIIRAIFCQGKLIGPPISESDKEWISKQKIFFHASAPLSKKHRVNVSPKSAQQFRVVDDSTVSFQWWFQTVT